MITLYDFDTKCPGRSISRYTWRVRGSSTKLTGSSTRILRGNSKSLGFLQEVTSDGTPRYTIPAIYDTSTGAKVADSLKIIKYLDEAYPDTHQLVTPDSEALTEEFAATLQKPLRFLWPLIIPNAIANLSGESSAKFRKAYEGAVKMTPEVLLQDEQRKDELWATVKEGSTALGEWITKHAGDGPWVVGSSITVLDVILGGGLAWIVGVKGEESDEWKKIREWDDGRLGAYWEQLKPFTELH